MNPITEAGGSSDLLSAIYGIQIRNEEKISDDDRRYCESLQEKLSLTLHQLKWWYGVFTANAARYKESHQLSYAENGSVKKRDPHRSSTDRGNYSELEFLPFDSIDEVVKLYYRAVYRFAQDIVSYFNDKYKLSVPHPEIDDENLPMGFQPKYQDYVDMVIAHLGGKNFRETAEEELVQRCLDSIRQRLYGSLKPEIKGSAITIPNFIRYRDYNWEKDNRINYEYYHHLTNLCAGIVFVVTGGIHAHSGYIAAFDSEKVDFTRWYGFITMDAINIKFFKNGRVDIKFKDKVIAERCFKKLRLDTIKTRSSDE